MRAKQFYNSINQLELECTCVGIGMDKWEQLMENAKQANTRIVERLVKQSGYIDENYFIGYNPHIHYRTETHIIWVHSAIEHFFKIR